MARKIIGIVLLVALLIVLACVIAKVTSKQNPPSVATPKSHWIKPPLRPMTGPYKIVEERDGPRMLSLDIVVPDQATEGEVIQWHLVISDNYFHRTAKPLHMVYHAGTREADGSSIVAYGNASGVTWIRTD